jgi:site-specific DNA-cytosine methylase
MIKVISLFSGIGGIDLGFKQAGLKLFGQMNLIKMRQPHIDIIWGMTIL